MAFQFAHIQTYSRKGNRRNATVAQICAEAARLPGNHLHVPEPLPPTHLFGPFRPEEVPDEIERRVAAAKKALRGKTRATKKVITVMTHVLEAQVYSHPAYVRPNPVEESADERPCLEQADVMAAYVAWREATVQFICKEAQRRGLEVLSVVEHLDEAHPHVHALLVPTNAQINAKLCHPGHTAADAAMARAAEEGFPKAEVAKATEQQPTARAGRKGGDSAKPLGSWKGPQRDRPKKKTGELTEGKILQRIGNRAYSEAMRKWQDLYQEEVGRDAGLLRTGPGRFRLSREEYMQRKQDAKALADALRAQRKAEDRRREAEAVLEPDSKLHQQVKQILSDALEQSNAVKAQQNDLENERERSREIIAEAGAAEGRVAELRAEETELARKVEQLKDAEARLTIASAEGERQRQLAADAEHRAKEAERRAKEAEKRAADAKANEGAAVARADGLALLGEALMEQRQDLDAQRSRLEQREADLDVTSQHAEEHSANASKLLLQAQAKEAGLEAWRLGLLSVQEQQLQCDDPEVRKQVAPAAAWLVDVIGPLEKKVSKAVADAKQSLRAKIDKAAQTIVALWARGALVASAEDGRPEFVGSVEVSEADRESIKGWAFMARAIIRRLPALADVKNLEARANALASALDSAEDRQFRDLAAAHDRIRRGRINESGE